MKRSVINADNLFNFPVDSLPEIVANELPYRVCFNKNVVRFSCTSAGLST